MYLLPNTAVFRAYSKSISEAMVKMFTSDGKGITDCMALFGFVNKFLSIFIEFMTVTQAVVYFG